ncbi:MAG TPA: hypothetical protein PLU35_04310 [Phycisphaerales bacterium]|nr:hypothetical protein [Phycisphaerales bacterium]
MSHEREFIENLLCQRFNFFLVVFGATIAGILASAERQHLLIVLWSAVPVLWLMTFTLWRAQHKLNLVFAELGGQTDHPAIVINRKAKGPSVRNLIGYGIPSFCSTLVSVALVLAYCGVLRPGASAS